MTYMYISGKGWTNVYTLGGILELLYAYVPSVVLCMYNYLYIYSSTLFIHRHRVHRSLNNFHEDVHAFVAIYSLDEYFRDHFE